MLTYTDPYLSPLATVAREEKAEKDVDALGAFPNSPIDWRDRLIVLRVYILTCIDSIKSNDDLFSVKLSAYRKEWDATLVQARAAIIPATGESPAMSLTVPLLRG